MERVQRLKKEAADQELEQNTRKSDLQAILAKVENDLKILMDRKDREGPGGAALKTAKDLKYVRDRQDNLGLAKFNMPLRSCTHDTQTIAISKANNGLPWFGY